MPSVADKVADAAVLAVQGLAWAAAITERLKTPSLPQGKDPPRVVVCVGEEGETEYLTSRDRLVKYPLAVVYFSAGGRKLADDAELRERREAVFNAVDAKAAFAAVPEFNAVSRGGRTPFDPGALPKDLNASVQVFTVEAIEGRT